MTKVNELGQQILRAKYYAPDESKPEDVFMRVAKVLSIPDVLDKIYREFAAVGNPDFSVFHPYEKEAAVAYRRAFGEKLTGTSCILEEIKGTWNVESGKYFDAMSSLDFMPATPTLISAGRTGMLSSCFFLRPKDSMEDIFECVKKASIIMKAGGGVGIDFSLIRPSGSPVKNTNGTATGPISYMKIFNSAGEQINAAGIRRAAMMASLRVDHPDVLNFIKCKETEGELKNFNISVYLTDEFMDAVEADSSFTLRHPKAKENKTVKAREIWDALVQGAWKNGEPGVIFEDTVRAGDVFKGKLGRLGPNPCVTGNMLITTNTGKSFVTELVGKPFTALVDGKEYKASGFTKTGTKPVLKIMTKSSYLRVTADHKLMRKCSDGKVAWCEAGLFAVGDNIVIHDHKNKTHGELFETILVVHPDGIEDVYDTTVEEVNAFDANGFYVHNCGELLLGEWESCSLCAINLSNIYDEDKKEVDLEKLAHLTKLGIRFLDNVLDMNNYPIPDVETSTLMTRRIGLGVTGLHDLMLKCEVSYGSDRSKELIRSVFSVIKAIAENTSKELGEIRGVPDALKEIGLLRRNCGLLTAQPTGSVSQILNQVSSGIEPIFQWSYTRKDTYGVHEMKHFMAEKFGHALPDYAKTALEIPPQDHITVQATIQSYLDAGISKTLNLPNEATLNDVEKALLMSYYKKCKSTTVYRSGSRQDEVLVSKDKKENKKTEVQEIIDNRPRFRPRVLAGVTFMMNTPGGKAFVTINEDKEGIREIFIHMSKAGSEVGSHVEAEGRLLSNGLKYRIPVHSLIAHLEGQKSSPIFENGELVKSVPDAVAKVMKEYVKDWEGFTKYMESDEDHVIVPVVEIEKKVTGKGVISGELCMECGEVLYRESGCETCHSCGYSKCG